MSVSKLKASAATSSQNVSGLVHQLTVQLTTLLRQELTLARTELYRSLARLLSATGAVVGGAVLLHAGFLLLLVAAVAGLAMFVPVWLAALSLGVLIGVCGWGLVSIGRRALKNAHLAPSHLPYSLLRDKEVLLRRGRP